MKQSYSAATAWTRLDKAINQNNAAVAELTNAANDVASAKSSKTEIYQQLMQEFVANMASPFGPDTLAAIDQKYADQFRSLHDQNAENKAVIDALVKRCGPVADIPARIYELDIKVSEAKTEYASLSKGYDDAVVKLDPVWKFDREAASKGKPQLTSQNISYFSSKTGVSGFFARIFDSHYKQGRKLIASFEKQGITIADTQSKFDQIESSLDKNKAASEKLSFERNILKETAGNIDKLTFKLNSDEQIQWQVTEKIISDAREKTVFDALTTKFPGSVPEYLVEMRAKIDAFDKLEANAREKAKQLKDMAKPIEKHLPDLKAASRKPGANVNVDLDQIEKALKEAQAQAKKNAEQVKKGKEKVTTYDRRYDTSTMALDVAVSALDAYTDLLMYDMLFDMMDGKLDGVGGILNGGLDLGGALSNSFSDIFNAVSIGMPNIADTLSKIDMPDMGGLADGIGNALGNLAEGAGDFFSGFDL